MAVFAALVVWSCRTPLYRRQGWRLAAEFGLVVLGMLLFSERTWKHHCVTLVLPFAVLSYYLAAFRPGSLLRAYLIASLAGSVLLMTATSTTGIRAFEFFDEAGRQGQVYGAYVWAYLVLASALIVLLRQNEEPVREADAVKGEEFAVRSRTMASGLMQEMATHPAGR
jgi:hypothetical protein